MRKKRSVQKVFRAKKFSVDQYWNMHYTEKYEDGSEKDFKSFIKAKSYELAKSILREKVREDTPKTKVKAIIGYMFHGKYKRSQNLKLSLGNWEQIKLASYPNINNFLFKKEVPRPEGYSNRFNKTNYDHISTIGFKKGKDNWVTKNRKGQMLPIEQRKGKKWTGDKWIVWDKKEVSRIKGLMIKSLKENNNARSLACKQMNVSRNKFYKLMDRIEGKEWWNKHYPPPEPKPPILPTSVRSAIQKKTIKKRMAEGYVPFQEVTKEHVKKRAEAKKKTAKALREKYYKELIPKIREAFSLHNNSRVLAAKHLGLKKGTFYKLLREIKKKYKINWTHEYPTPSGRSQYKV